MIFLSLFFISTYILKYTGNNKFILTGFPNNILQLDVFLIASNKIFQPNTVKKSLFKRKYQIKFNLLNIPDGEYTGTVFFKGTQHYYFYCPIGTAFIYSSALDTLLKNIEVDFDFSLIVVEGKIKSIYK